MADTKNAKPTAPDERPIGATQAARLAKLSGLNAKELVGKPVAALHERLRWILDPELLFMRRICGRVVKRNPATGALEAVPNATVHVEDTDCSFLCFAPPLWPDWCWFFPFHCHREEIGTATTDHCGRFCVWIPRWDIDWIVRWRHARICFRDFARPRLRDLIERLKPEPLPDPPEIHRPPLPDPPEVAIRKPAILAQLREKVGPSLAGEIEGLVARESVAVAGPALATLLATPVIPLPPPVPADFERSLSAKAADAAPAISGLTPEALAEIKANRWIGPFWRCKDVLLGIWTRILDVPDITFRVTQDVDADGDEETIYSEGFFDVRWNAGPIPDVTLLANATALSTPACEGPDIDPSGCTKPEILTAGLMPLRAPQFDPADGYALHVNKPRPGGLSTSPQAAAGQAPFWATIQLHGCYRFPNVAFYRLLYSYEGNAEVPFVGLSWWAPRVGPGAPFHVVGDAQGWYAVLPAADLVFPYWLLNWETWGYSNGKYTVRLELGDAAKAVIGASGPVSLRIDNTRPNGTFGTLRWRPAGGGWQVLPDVCPVIHRPAGSAVELEVTYYASADHFRNVVLIGYGCGAGNMVRVSSADHFDHWHTSLTDNAWSATAIFSIAAAAAEGAYTVGLDVYGRAFNPAGGDAGPGSGWDYNVEYSWSFPRRSLAIVDA